MAYPACRKPDLSIGTFIFVRIFLCLFTKRSIHEPCFKRRFCMDMADTVIDIVLDRSKI